MKNHGFTVVELIITFVIIMTICIGLFKVVDSYREKQQMESARKEVLNYKNQILKSIEDDVIKYGIDNIKIIDLYNESDCNEYDQGIRIKYKNNDNSEILCIKSQKDESNAEVLYKNNKFIAPSKFISIDNDIIYSSTGEISYEDSLFELYKISFSLNHKELEQKFPLNITFKKTLKSGVSSVEQSNNVKELKLGDEVTLGDQSFRIVDIDYDLDTVSLLTKYNLNLNDEDNKQLNNNDTKSLTAFSSTSYWFNYKDDYYDNDFKTYGCSPSDGSDCFYLYKKKTGEEESRNNLTGPINKYVDYLKKNNVPVITSELLTYQNVKDLKYELENNKTYPAWLCGADSSSYWLGTRNYDQKLGGSSKIYACNNITSDSNKFISNNYSTSNKFGIRPIIVVPKKYLENS